MKTSRVIKNQLPNVYGYETLEDLKNDPSNNLSHWIFYEFADGDRRFVPCTEEFFHQYRNDERNFARRMDTESRCMITSKVNGLVKCRKNCDECSHSRTGKPVSIDYMYENYEYEYPDESYLDTKENNARDERFETLMRLVKEFNDVDQEIINLYMQGKTDKEIGEILSKPKTTVTSRRYRLFDLLRQKVKEI